jgi:hypothetical protein
MRVDRAVRAGEIERAGGDAARTANDPADHVAAWPGSPARAGDLLLTERILRVLPGPGLGWMVVWALAAIVRPIELVIVLGATGEPARAGDIGEVFRTQGLFAYVVLVTLWGAVHLADRIEQLAPALRSLAPDGPPTQAFPRLTSRLGPIALTAAVVAVATPTTVVEYGSAVAVVDLPILTIMVLPIMTFVWTYGVLLAGLDRLGRSRLSLDLFPQDRTLGLAPVGQAAFTGFWLTFAAAAPLLLVSGQDEATLVIGVAVVAATVALFVLSMARIHAQMREAKGRYVTMARAFVAVAYEPIRANGTLETIQERAPALSAAQAIADRAEKILEWPIDERMVAFMTVVVTGVVTSLAVRFVLEAAGL